MVDLRILAGAEAAHPDDSAYLTWLLAAGYSSPSITHNGDEITVYFYTTSGNGNYNGTGPDFHSAVRDALAKGASFVPSKEQVDAAVESEVAL